MGLKHTTILSCNIYVSNLNISRSNTIHQYLLYYHLKY